MLPIFQQFAIPSLLAILAALSVFYPLYHLTPPTVKTHAQKEKKVLGNMVQPTPTLYVSPTPRVYVYGQKQAGSSHTTSTAPMPAQTSADSLGDNTKTNSVNTAQQTQVVVSSNPTPTATVTVQSKTITAKSTIVASGKTIHLVMQYPSLGGAISGTMSGDCTGTISGTYAGQSSNTLSGTGNATCPMGLFSIPVSITYSGTLISTSQANISYTVQAIGKTEKGTTVMSLSQ